LEDLEFISSVGKMNQRAIALYLARTGLLAVDVHADLVATLEPKSLSFLSVVHCLRQPKFATSKRNIICLEPELELDD
jgi:hypothetical protein